MQYTSTSMVPAPSVCSLSLAKPSKGALGDLAKAKVLQHPSFLWAHTTDTSNPDEDANLCSTGT